MKVTDIKQQVKRAGRFSIFVDGKYSFSLSDTAILENPVRVGQELDEAELKAFKELSADDKIYNATLNYLAIRPRSEWELRQYMQRKHSPAPLVDQILNKLSIMGYVDDEKFARSWVDSRRLLRPSSFRKLQSELQAKHISREVIGRVLQKDTGDERTTLRAIIERKRARYPDEQKLMQYLARQGFSYDDIKSALKVEEEY
jgi:regulatory protein